MRNEIYTAAQRNGSYRPYNGAQGSEGYAPRFKKMEALYPGKCFDCLTELNAGDFIYYSRQDGGAMCELCGMQRYEKHLLPQPSTNSVTSLVVMPLTLLSQCYCVRVKRTCGFCVAKLMEARATTPKDNNEG